jgi:transposase
LAAYLHTYQLLPLERTTHLLGVLSGCRPSEATLLASIQRMTKALEPYVAQIREALLRSLLIHSDETGVKMNKVGHWIHVASNEAWTHLHAHQSRGSEGMLAGQILSEYRGTVCHDFYGPYFKQPKKTKRPAVNKAEGGFAFKHTLCNAHLSRECKGIEENDGHAWAKAMRQLLHESWAATREVRQANAALAETVMADWERQYDHILREGEQELAEKSPPAKKGKRGKPTRTKSENLWARFRDHKEHILGFLRDANLPFDNNQGERDLRMVAVKRKISGCFRTESMLKSFTTMRSFVSTLIKKQLPILASLMAAYQGTFAFSPQGAE